MGRKDKKLLAIPVRAHNRCQAKYRLCALVNRS